MLSFRFMMRPTWTISALWHESKYKSKFNLKFYLKKNQISGFLCCSTREDLPIDISITNVGMILKLRCIQHFGTNQNTSHNSILNFFFLIKLKWFVFPCCSTREYLSIDVSIINVGLISTKPGRFFFRVWTKFNFINFEVFWKNNSIFWVSML